MDQVILAIDIGSSKICSLIAEIKSSNPHILGVGIQKAKGIQKGAIANIEEASRSIRESVNDAKRVAGINISKAIISISGACTQSTNNTAILSISSLSPSNLGGRIGDIDIRHIDNIMESALYNAYKTSIPNDYEVLHVLPYSFKVDGKDYINDPLGMSGSLLEVSVHIVMAQKSEIENLKKAVRNAGVEVESIVLSSYASSIAVLSDDEKELGVACVDIGAGTCDIMVYYSNAMRCNYFLGVGSHHVTLDIANSINSTPAAAEEIKVKYGTLHQLDEDEKNSLLEGVPTIGSNLPKKVPLELVHGVAFVRVKETLELICDIADIGKIHDNLGSGVVITGGMAHMKGLVELASGIFYGLPVRVAIPKEVDGTFFDKLKEPEYATAIGLILYASGRFTNYEIGFNKKLKYRKSQQSQLRPPTRSPEEESGADDQIRETSDLSNISIRTKANTRSNNGNNLDIKLDAGKRRSIWLEWLDSFKQFLKKLF